MAAKSQRVAENVPGNFFVDRSCIDCDQCREVAPETFGDAEGHARVWRQPDSRAGIERAAMALLTCPVGAIGSEDPGTLAAALPSAIAHLPERIEDNVYFCGFASSASYGASSYLVVRPEGNILVDSPRFTARLVGRLADLGGIRSMFLSHQDDIADHEQFHRKFGCERIFHSAEDRAAAASMERLISGTKPQPIGPDLLAIPTPGHTRGHMVLLYRDRYLFTGDHVWWSPERQELSASRRYNWYSWKDQIKSMERLLDYSFEWILPGHGRRHHAPEPVMRQLVSDCVLRMKRH